MNRLGTLHYHSCEGIRTISLGIYCILVPTLVFYHLTLIKVLLNKGSSIFTEMKAQASKFSDSEMVRKHHCLMCLGWPIGHPGH
jgi:hypothetical protein